MGPNIEWDGEGCGVVGSQGIIRMGQTVSQVDGDSDMALTCAYRGRTQ